MVSHTLWRQKALGDCLLVCIISGSMQLKAVKGFEMLVLATTTPRGVALGGSVIGQYRPPIHKPAAAAYVVAADAAAPELHIVGCAGSQGWIFAGLYVSLLWR